MHPAVSNGSYDVAQIRKDFPALALKVYGKPLVYLDNAASAQKPKQVLDRLQKAYTEQYANVHRGLHYLANEATEAYEGARETVRAFLNAGRKEEVIFTRNATEAINLVAYTFARERIKAGDEIVLSIMSSIRSASSMIRSSHPESSSRPRSKWSSSRPGVAISTSTPRSNFAS